MRERAAPIPVLSGYGLQNAEVSGGRVHLNLVSADGAKRLVSASHVIAATGYNADAGRLPFLSPEILRRLHLIGKSPRLSAHFESSVRGLYFVGPIAATSFGPVMRFAAGAHFTSRTISRHLATTLDQDAAQRKAVTGFQG
jgi:hypothetical protein